MSGGPGVSGVAGWEAPPFVRDNGGYGIQPGSGARPRGDRSQRGRPAGAANAHHQHLCVAGRAGSGARVRAERQPGLGGRRGGAGRRRGAGRDRGVVRVRPGGVDGADARAGRGPASRRIPPGRLLQHAGARGQAAPAWRRRGDGRPARPRRGRRGTAGGASRAVGRDAHQPATAGVRPGCPRRDRGGVRRAVRGGQHGRHRAAATAARVRRGGVDVLAHQDDLRPLRRAGRRGRHPRRGAERAAARLAHRGRRHPGAVRELAGAARAQDAAVADGAALRERAGDRRVPGGPSPRDRGALSRAQPVAGGGETDATGIRAAAGVRDLRDRGGRRRRGRRGPPGGARHQLRRRGIELGTAGALGRGDRAGNTDPAIGGNRARRRPDRRHRRGPCGHRVIGGTSRRRRRPVPGPRTCPRSARSGPRSWFPPSRRARNGAAAAPS